MATLNQICDTSTARGHLFPIAVIAERIDTMLAEGSTLHHVHGLVDNSRGIIRKPHGARFLLYTLAKLARGDRHGRRRG